MRHLLEQNFLRVLRLEPRRLAEECEQIFHHDLALFYLAYLAKNFFGRTQCRAFCTLVPVVRAKNFLSLGLRQKRGQNRRAQLFVGKFFRLLLAAFNFLRRQSYLFRRDRFLVPFRNLKAFGDSDFFDERLPEGFVNRVEDFFLEKFQLVFEGGTFHADKKNAVLNRDGHDLRGDTFVDEPTPILNHFVAEKFFVSRRAERANLFMKHAVNLNHKKISLRSIFSC